MAYEGPSGIKLTGLVAAADLSALQYTFVKLDANGLVAAASAQGEDCIGVLQNDPVAGEECEIVCVGVTKVSADSAIDEMDAITTAADGQADQAASADFVLGKALTAATAADDIITIVVNCAATTVV
jgi:hypothetical protein